MDEITVKEIIDVNTDYSNHYHHFMYAKWENIDGYYAIKDEVGKTFFIKKGKGISIKKGRRNIARHIAERSHMSIDEADEMIELEGCEKANKMGIGYKYCYLRFDDWLVVKER